MYNTNNKVWYSVNLTPADADYYKDYLRENNITFEPSSFFDLIHIEIFMSEDEAARADAFLQTF